MPRLVLSPLVDIEAIIYHVHIRLIDRGVEDEVPLNRFLLLGAFEDLLVVDVDRDFARLSRRFDSLLTDVKPGFHLVLAIPELIRVLRQVVLECLEARLEALDVLAHLADEEVVLDGLSAGLEHLRDAVQLFVGGLIFNFNLFDVLLDFDPVLAQ